MRIIARCCLAGWCLTALIGSIGCSERLDKKDEKLISPNERGTEAEKEPAGPVQHGEAPSDVGKKPNASE